MHSLAEQQHQTSSRMLLLYGGIASRSLQRSIQVTELEASAHHALHRAHQHQQPSMLSAAAAHGKDAQPAADASVHSNGTARPPPQQPQQNLQQPRPWTHPKRPGWRRWGDAQLLAAWQAAAAELPAAVEQLAAVSLRGPARLVCFDLEASSTIQPVDVMELAAATAHGQRFRSLVSPLTAISPGATAVTGLAWAEVRGGPPLAVALLAWVRWLARQCAAAPGGSSTLVLMGHNIRRFDLPVLRAWAGAMRQPRLQQLLQPPAAAPTLQAPCASWPCIDTLSVAQALKSLHKNALQPDVLQALSAPGGTKLQALRELFGIEANNAHRVVAAKPPAPWNGNAFWFAAYEETSCAAQTAFFGSLHLTAVITIGMPGAFMVGAHLLVNSPGAVLSSLLRQAMLRLLQGDVGCGKTVVAVLACLAVRQAGHQALLLAPTTLLAAQHMATLSSIADRLPLALRPREKAAMKARLARGDVDLLVSTQALWLNGGWSKLALVVVDEQHKFGVRQRERLLQGLCVPPHMLLMSATPIPRTLALVQFGGLVLSSISSMPPGRSRVETQVVRTARKRGSSPCVVPVNFCRHSFGCRAWCTLRSGRSWRLAAACTCVPSDEQLEKEAVLAKFNSGETPVLISSTVVEVGIDEPEASVMLVENADRFGLAQLHQLRGRVGRGSRASRCFLMAPPAGAAGAAVAAKRLRVLERSHNGLVIAQADLEISSRYLTNCPRNYICKAGATAPLLCPNKLVTKARGARRIREHSWARSRAPNPTSARAATRRRKALHRPAREECGLRSTTKHRKKKRRKRTPAAAATCCLAPLLMRLHGTAGHMLPDDGGDMAECPPGTYKEGWDRASSCTPCGEGPWLSDPQMALIWIDPAENYGSTVYVRGSPNSCYIQPGMGIDRTGTASVCPPNTFGNNVERRFGTNPAPCMSCLNGLVTVGDDYRAVSYNDSQGAAVPIGEGGYFDVLACLTPPGFGYTSYGAAPCDIGSYNEGGNLLDCTLQAWFLLQRLPGTTTAATGSQSADRCELCAAGYGAESASSCTPCQVWCLVRWTPQAALASSLHHVSGGWMNVEQTDSLQLLAGAAAAALVPGVQQMIAEHMGGRRMCICLSQAVWQYEDCWANMTMTGQETAG
ncbi:hypothetical protein COO60DRAFT_1625888 [Scenedesmus sp. NREL 46B-D3]|nr:hypothetical protein COO60DRAFT_1625888 [Scenedesmus sp. NREL 46B-D3]